MDDTIYRQAAIDALIEFSVQRDAWDSQEGFAQKRGINASICAIEDLPSAERRGNWVGIDDEPCDVWECDRCGHIVERECPPRFCEECGARMEVE